MTLIKLFTLASMMLIVVFNIAQASDINDQTSTTSKSKEVEDHSFLDKISKAKLLKVKPGLTSKTTHKKIEKALKYAAKEQYNHAADELIQLLKKTNKRKYEFAQVWQNLGFVLAQKGDYPKAMKALENSIKINSLPYADTMNSLYTIAQLNIATEKYSDALVVMNKWGSLAEKISPEAYVLWATAHAQAGNKEKALEFVNEAIKTTEKPQEKWLQFALALNHEMKKYGNALKILVMLTSSFPENDKYWKQLSSTYLSLEQDDKALAVMELAHKLNHIKAEADLLNMVSLYMYLNLPQKGAQLLEKELIAGRISSKQKNLELLSQAWLSAREREKALLVLDKAAKEDRTGNLYARKAFLHLEKEEWDNVIASLNKSLAKGHLDKKDRVYFALGIAQYNKKNFNAALSSFMEARKYASYKTSINRWIEQTKMDKLSQNI